MELKKGAIVREIGPDHEHASKWQVLRLMQATRHRSSYLARNAKGEFEDHQVIVTVCRYEPRLLRNRGYVDNVRRRLLHEAEMLTIPHNLFPEPVDLFRTQNAQDQFAFGEAERYRETEPVLVTEPYYGTPLDELVTRGGPLAQRRALRVGLKLCDLLEDLHQRDILVYEFRPEDILVDTAADDRLWILGCANLQKINGHDRVAVKDLIVPLSDFTYTAPEVEAGTEPLDKRADIYSFGALMLYMLTGHKARQFVGRQAHNEAAYGLRQLSPATCRLLGRCLSFDPVFRTMSPDELRAGLREALLSVEHPHPQPAQHLTIEGTGEQRELRWQLPDDWSQGYGLTIRRWRATADEPPPDVEHWDVVIDEKPSDALALTVHNRKPRTTIHYAVIVQAPFQGGWLASHPVFTAWRLPRDPERHLPSLLAALVRALLRKLFVLVSSPLRRLGPNTKRLKRSGGSKRGAGRRSASGKVPHAASRSNKAAVGKKHPAASTSQRRTGTPKTEGKSAKSGDASRKAATSKRPPGKGKASPNSKPKSRATTAGKKSSQGGKKPVRSKTRRRG